MNRKQDWLDKHPGKGIAWLNMCLNDGFVLQETDSGYALTWGQDADKVLTGKVVEPMVVGPVNPHSSKGAWAYALREHGETWKDIGNQMNLSAHYSLLLAKSYAKVNELIWPLYVH